MSVSNEFEAFEKQFERPVVFEFFEDHPLLAKALEYQMVLNQDKQKFAELEAALELATHYVTELDARAETEGLVGQIVTLKGDKIVAPQIKHDAKLGSFDIYTGYITVDDELDPFTEPGLTGEFYGFTPIAIMEDPDTELYTPKIAYQIKFGKKDMGLPNATGLLAYTSVDTAEIEFLEDRKKKDARKATDILLQIDNMRTAALIQRLDDLLQADDPFEQLNLHMINDVISVHLNETIDELTDKEKDALFDLIRARLGIYSSELFEFSALASIETTSDTQYFIHPKVSGISAISDVVFSPYYHTQNKGTWSVDEERRALSFVVDQRDKETDAIRLVQIAFDKIERLRPMRGPHSIE